jgi:hypothetical protein
VAPGGEPHESWVEGYSAEWIVENAPLLDIGAVAMPSFASVMLNSCGGAAKAPGVAPGGCPTPRVPFDSGFAEASNIVDGSGRTMTWTFIKPPSTVEVFRI